MWKVGRPDGYENDQSGWDRQHLFEGLCIMIDGLVHAFLGIEGI